MQKSYKLENLCCAHCASNMEHAIKKINGVQSAAVVFMTQKLILEADEENFQAVLEEVKKAIRKVEPDCKIIEP